MTFSPNQLVIFVKDGTLEGGVALEENKKGLLLLLADGSQTRVATRDVAFVEQAGSAAAGPALAQRAATIAQRASQLDLEPVWELLLEEELPAFSSEDIAALCDPGSEDHFPQVVRAALHAPDSLFKRKGDTWTPIPRKTVLERQKQKEQELQRNAAENQVVEQLESAMAKGDVNPGVQPPEVKAALGIIRTAAFERDSVAPAATRLLSRLFTGDSRPYPLLAFDFMVTVGLWDEHEDVNLLRLDLPHRFSDEALQQAAQAKAAVPQILAGREDRSHLYTVAIDDADTVEVDDALALEQTPNGWNVHVFIADLAAGIRRGTALDTEAAQRASTVYHPTRRIPMLPPVLSEDAFSLNQGEPRAALDHVFFLDKTYRQYDFSIKPCVVCVDRRLTYEEADELLEHRADEQGVMLDRLWDIARARFAERRNQGAISFFPLEHKVRVEGGRVTLKVIDNYSSSRRLVAEFMVATGSSTGTLLHEMGIPVIYRNQKGPDEPIEWSENAARDPVYMNATVRRLRRAEVTLQPGRHAGLGLESYCQVTSPLRRYADLLIQRQLHSALLTRVAAYGEGELLDAMAMADESAGAIRKAVGAAEHYWKLTALKEQVGRQVAGTVIHTERGRAWVLLDDFGVTVRVFPKSVVDPGAQLVLKVMHVEPRTDSVVLAEE